MKKLLMAVGWLYVSAGLILSLGAFGYYQTRSKSTPVIQRPQLEASQAHSNDPEVLGAQTNKNGVGTVIETADSRPEIVASFLARHNSPLEPHDEYGEILVEIADRYNIDFRLLPAIAMQESNLCKAYPAETHNCLGFGIHSRGTLGFDSYEEGFDRAAREIKANYIDIGLTTPEEIMTKYTPSSDGSWANSVNQWMAEMRYNDRQLGRTQKTNADVLEFVEPEE